MRDQSRLQNMMSYATGNFVHMLTGVTALTLLIRDPGRPTVILALTYVLMLAGSWMKQKACTRMMLEHIATWTPPESSEVPR